MKKAKIQVVLDEKDIKFIKQKADEEYLSVSPYMRKIIKGWIKNEKIK